MEYSRQINMPIPVPPEHNVGWFDVLNLVQAVTPWFILGGVFWRMIDRIVKYFSDGREAEMNKLIDAKTAPLTDAIDKLTEAVNKLTYSSKI